MRDTERYTPPVPVTYKRSSRIVPILMFTFFGLGVLIILLGYLPNSPGVSFLAKLAGFDPSADYVYVVTGLILISLGFVVATRYK